MFLGVFEVIAVIFYFCYGYHKSKLRRIVERGSRGRIEMVVND